jgi:hypothetical protein
MIDFVQGGEPALFMMPDGSLGGVVRGILPDLKDGASTLQSRRLSGIEPENLPCRSIPHLKGWVFTQTALIDQTPGGNRKP